MQGKHSIRFVFNHWSRLSSLTKLRISLRVHILLPSKYLMNGPSILWKLNWTGVTWLQTTTYGKLPKDSEEQGKTMTQRCAYLVKVHNIPKELIVNTGQTWIYLVPIWGSRTWETIGANHIKVHGTKDKRQITVTISSATNKHCLSF